MTLSVPLPDGRRVRVASEVSDRLLCGVQVLCPVAVSGNHEVDTATENLSRELVTRYSGLKPAEIPALTEARNLYKSFGVDPSRHRPSSEALLRRVLKGRGLYQINNAVDCCNLASLGFLLPVGMYDLDRVEGDIDMRVGRPGEEYPGIRKDMVHLEGRLGLFDQEGPFGSPTSDSARTCVSASTRNILAVVMATASYCPAAMSGNLDTFGNLFIQYCQATEIFRTVLGSDLQTSEE
ncbi:MAG: hypothetical protein KOO60_11540 [Gemmatimonadales bacterium]|nr:hypothetical protein [Gemmatimonadales bacterium]